MLRAREKSVLVVKVFEVQRALAVSEAAELAIATNVQREAVSSYASEF